VQAMAPAAIFILALVIYTGFAIPTRDMHPWFRWINYLDPVAYGFEALMINEVRLSGKSLIKANLITLVSWQKN
jgi:ABC-type multidrug transport system permease subunit